VFGRSRTPDSCPGSATHAVQRGWLGWVSELPAGSSDEDVPAHLVDVDRGQYEADNSYFGAPADLRYVVLPVEDSLASIFRALADAAVLHQAGAGTGYSFSRLRPRGDPVASTRGMASGPVSFLLVLDSAAQVLAEGGRRRGASMAVLDVSHPDIVEFIDAKRAGGLSHFNLSVAVPGRFVRAAHSLVNPRTGRAVARVPAVELFGRLCEAAWQGGDPGLLFTDRINRDNPLPALGRIEATNPCGEVPLLPYESCNLGSINLSRLVTDGRVDFRRLGAAVHLAIRFLDDVIEVSR
jgi:ribonucleoside-diphosphate reductase alpha chain